MRLQLLISTVNKNLNFLFEVKKKLNNVDFLIVNQVSKVNTNDLNSIGFYSFNEKGLSKSRNKAIEFANCELCLICDDDTEFLLNFKEIIQNAYLNNPHADIITFQIITPENKPYKKYSKYIKKHNRYSILKVSSIEITFKLDTIRNNKIKFDERFGLGALYKGGEENIFLKDALDMGLNLYYYPEPIVIHPAESSNKLINNDFFHGKGAVLKRLYGEKGILISGLFFLFQLRKIKDYTQIFKYLKSFITGWNSVK